MFVDYLIGDSKPILNLATDTICVWDVLHNLENVAMAIFSAKDWISAFVVIKKLVKDKDFFKHWMKPYENNKTLQNKTDIFKYFESYDCLFAP